MNRPSLTSATPEASRRAFRMLTVDMRPAASIVPVRETQDIEVAGAAGALPARVYRPEADGPVPTIVFFHGGGFVIGDLETHDDHARLLCRDVGAVVLSVDYRL
ncbi:MAG: alpha/beta hydrolase fold domain-containing protein, partial [Thermoleophilaceae bacterium]|nr:alpha/beta hydrolase fold domain-containing protein [Thermoleophilaceae bacterium]